MVMIMRNSEIVQLAQQVASDNNYHLPYLAIVDFTRLANEHRFFIVSLSSSNIVYSHYTSHGSGSGDVDKAILFSNIPDSRMSNKGLLKTGVTYTGKHGFSRKLIGLEDGINDNCESRAIVLHRSDYVTDDYIHDNNYPGRSWGCITLNPDDADDIIGKLQRDSLVFVNTD